MFENCTNVYPIIESIYELNQQLIYRNMYYHKIITNKDNSVITMLENKPFVMLKLSPVKDMPITIFDIKGTDVVTINKKLEQLVRFNWTTLWENKIDYFEYQVNQFGKRYPKIRDSFGYYAGITETGISLYRMINNNQNNKMIVSHKRINHNSTLYDLYNPLNLVIDYKVRDVAEYFKSLFLIRENVFEDIIYYFNQNYLTGYECLIFFNRMLYPSFYFDIYEKIIESEKNIEKLDDIIKKNKDYEELIKSIYNYLAYNINVPDIEWLKKT